MDSLDKMLEICDLGYNCADLRYDAAKESNEKYIWLMFKSLFTLIKSMATRQANNSSGTLKTDLMNT